MNTKIQCIGTSFIVAYYNDSSCSKFADNNNLVFSGAASACSSFVGSSILVTCGTDSANSRLALSGTLNQGNVQFSSFSQTNCNGLPNFTMTATNGACVRLNGTLNNYARVICSSGSSGQWFISYYSDSKCLEAITSFAGTSNDCGGLQKNIRVTCPSNNQGTTSDSVSLGSFCYVSLIASMIMLVANFITI